MHIQRSCCCPLLPQCRTLRISCSWKLGDRPRRVALLIDDAQEAYRPNMPGSVLVQLQKLLGAARAAGVPVIWSRWCRTSPHDGHYGAHDEFSGPWGVASHDNPLYIASTRGAAIMEELAPRTEAEPARVIDSYAFDCFAARSEGSASKGSGSILRDLLETHHVDTQLLLGCWTESCILSTALRALSENFNVAVARDACFTCVDVGPTALQVLGAYCSVVPTAEIVGYLRSLGPAATEGRLCEGEQHVTTPVVPVAAARIVAD